MGNLVTESVEILTSGISGYATGFGAGLKTLVTNILMDTDSQGAKHLSDFGGVVMVFGALSLAIGLSRWFLGFVTSIGQRNR